MADASTATTPAAFAPAVAAVTAAFSALATTAPPAAPGAACAAAVGAQAAVRGRLLGITRRVSSDLRCVCAGRAEAVPRRHAIVVCWILRAGLSKLLFAV